MADLQSDVTSLPARAVLPYVLAVLEGSANCDETVAAGLLRQWNCVLDSGNRAGRRSDAHTATRGGDRRREMTRQVARWVPAPGPRRPPWRLFAPASDFQSDQVVSEQPQREPRRPWSAVSTTAGHPSAVPGMLPQMPRRARDASVAHQDP